MGISQKKKALRKTIMELKKAAGTKQMQRESRELVLRLEQNKQFQDAECVLAYWPMPDEIDLRALILKWQSSKSFLLPVVKDDYLEIRKFDGEESLVPSPHFGILEPAGQPFAELSKIDLVLVPGLAFDKSGYRLGRGKAYYDRLLPRLVNAYKLGVGFSFQLLEEVPCEPHDELLDEVLIGSPEIL
ncbi:MAG TPA: 5-formyltetrahydrofolate cyclo-ligase [Marinilabiliaceae bacterium]|nr:5-formyltetrahydrofolate cyclo-ligase [Marinilabiliaceae bacterium]